MLPLLDIHCHLFPALDDGPKTLADSLAMARMALEEGTELVFATAHQNEGYPEVTAEAIEQAHRALQVELAQAEIPLKVSFCAEVMVQPDLLEDWDAGKYLSYCGLNKHVLIELPHGLFVDIGLILKGFRDRGVQPILAHPERIPGFLSRLDILREWIRLGCLMQVSARSVTHGRQTNVDGKLLKRWFQEGYVHFLASDGHSLRGRQPVMREAYEQVEKWVGTVLADRVTRLNALGILQGREIRANIPEVKKRGWWF